VNFITTLHQMNINNSHNVMKTETAVSCAWNVFICTERIMNCWCDNHRLFFLLLLVNSTSFYDEKMMSLFIVPQVLRTNKQAIVFPWYHAYGYQSRWLPFYPTVSHSVCFIRALNYNKKRLYEWTRYIV
jgi:hypothetical protein